MSVLKNVKSGIWKVYAAIDTIDSWGKRVYVLELWHSEVKQDPNPNWVEHSTLGVDSGTMSVIDDAYYRRKNGSVDYFEASEKAHDAFVEKCFKITDRHNGVGLFKADKAKVVVVCSSGIGDGAYPLDIVEQNGEVVAIKINFM